MKRHGADRESDASRVPMRACHRCVEWLRKEVASDCTSSIAEYAASVSAAGQAEADPVSACESGVKLGQGRPSRQPQRDAVGQTGRDNERRGAFGAHSERRERVGVSYRELR